MLQWAGMDWQSREASATSHFKAQMRNLETRRMMRVNNCKTNSQRQTTAEPCQWQSEAEQSCFHDIPKQYNSHVYNALVKTGCAFGLLPLYRCCWKLKPLFTYAFKGIPNILCVSSERIDSLLWWPLLTGWANQLSSPTTPRLGLRSLISGGEGKGFRL